MVAYVLRSIGVDVLTRKALEEAATALLCHTLHISTSQSMCGRCGRKVTWTDFTPRCNHCGAEWLFVVAGFFVSDYTDEDYRLRCETLAPGLRYLSGEGLSTAEPSPGYLGPPLRVQEE